MQKKNRVIVFLVAFLAANLASFAVSQSENEAFPAKISVQVDQPQFKVSPSLYGIFFEEINLAGDGGIYPELIRNRSFEFNAEHPEFWSLAVQGDAAGTMELATNDAGSEYNAKVLKIDVARANGRLAVVNEGYWGVPVVNGDDYEIVVRAKADKNFDGVLELLVLSHDGAATHAKGVIERLSKDWQTYTMKIRSNAYDPKARFAVVPNSSGSFLLDYVSFKPVKTYNGNGLRTDLMQKLDGLSPSFVRFPGGCWVEGDTMAQASRWKRTVGNPMNRWTQPNLWGYQSTNGLGYHEYLQMCEDLNAAALFVINCGMAHKDHIPMDKMEEFVQDALDAIEYANGPTDSTWGKVRAANGHPEPFNLQYIQIGNENGGLIYWERYDLFYDRIREKYPDMKIVANEWGGQKTNKRPIEILDEHYYNNPAFFVNNATRYDDYNRKGPKIYVGEYAVTRDCGQGNLNGAIGEAAFMTGMERNSDIVVMSSYAPLFVHVNHRRWNPDLICFDGTRSYGIPSYYVQQLFARHRSDVIVPCEVWFEKPEEKTGGAVGVGSWSTQVEYKDAKIVKDGRVIYESTQAKSANGNWRFVDGVLRQTSNATDCRYVFGDSAWDDYTFQVKARKISGQEGFLILFNVKPNGNWAWLNIGGWGNSATGIEIVAGAGAADPRSDFTVETDRWYDIRIEQQGQNVKCFIDDKLILEQTMPKRSSAPVHIVSGLNETGDELILKVVNSTDMPCQAEIALSGVENLDKSAKQIVLTSENGLDENSLDYPEKVSPKESTFTIDGATFARKFPGKSLTVLRIGVK